MTKLTHKCTCEKYKFKQGQEVIYRINGGNDLHYQGKGKIVGVCSTSAAVIGATYIVEDLENIFPNEMYPYSHFACFEMWLEAI